MTQSRTSVALSSTFIGRERELAELGDGLSAVRPGHGGLFLIRGEAGIGKTRLAEELSSHATRRGETVHWGRCIEGAGAPAFWPWIQVLRAIAAGRGLTTACDRERASIARLMQEPRAEVPSQTAAEDTPSSPAWVQAESERFQLFDAIATVLQRVADQGAFGIVLDDLHVADLPSLRLLEVIARQSPSFWIIGTYREVEAHTDPQRRDAIASITRVGRSLTLRGLSQLEVGRLIEHALGAPSPPALVRRISDLTEGNPFFVDEVTRLLWSQGEHTGSEIPAQIPVPSGVREVVRRRMRRLSPECVRVLQAAAVVGRELSFTLLREVAAIDAPRLLDLIEEAQAIRILEPRPGRRLAFGHALIRETLYDDLSASTRVELHRRVGAALERLYPASLEEHLPELAYHFARVAPAGDADKALDYAERAARRATAALAYEDAAQLYELALESLPLLAAPTASPREIDVLLALGDVHIRAGDMPRARVVFERAAAAARVRGDVSSLARAALGCGGLGLGIPQGTVDRPLVDLLEEVLAQPAHAYPSALRVRLLARLALELYFSDAVMQRRALMNEAWALATDADAPTRATLMHARLVGLWDITPPADRLCWSNDLIALAEGIGDGDLALRGHMYRLLEIIDTGIAGGWEPELDTVTALVERLREPRFVGMATGTRAMHSVWVGRFTEAEALGTQALEIAQSVGDLNTPVSIAAQAFFMLRLRGEPEDVDAFARATFAGAPTIPGARCMVVLALCGLGRFDAARTELEQLGDTDFDLLRRANRLASLVPWLAEASVLLGDTARMQSLYRDLLPLAERNITLQARVCFGPAALYLGMIAAGLGRHDEALRHLEAARALAARMRGRPLVALIQTEHARVLLSMGALAMARSLLGDARATTAALGMDAVTQKIDALRAGCDTATVDAVAPPPRPIPKDRGHSNTASLRREGPLWTIAAGGTVLRCKSSKGLQYLVHLLRNPGKSFHVVELLALDDRASAQRREIETMDLGQHGMHIGSPQVGEPIADAKALAAYRSRLEDLATELSEATRFNDLARGTRIQEEIDVLTQALLSAVGFGGRARATGSFVERARLNVTRAIRSAIRRIGEGHPDLEQHLAACLRTGTFCSYDPKPGEAPRWEL